MPAKDYTTVKQFTFGGLAVQVWADPTWSGGPVIAPDGRIEVWPSGTAYFDGAAAKALNDALAALFTNNPAIAQAIGSVNIFVALHQV